MLVKRAKCTLSPMSSQQDILPEGPERLKFASVAPTRERLRNKAVTATARLRIEIPFVRCIIGHVGKHHLLANRQHPLGHPQTQKRLFETNGLSFGRGPAFDRFSLVPFVSALRVTELCLEIEWRPGFVVEEEP